MLAYTYAYQVSGAASHDLGESCLSVIAAGGSSGMRNDGMRNELTRRVFERVRLVGITGLLVCPLLTAPVLLAQTTEPAPAAAAKKQLPADQRAFKAARATMDPAKRLEAMRAFVHDYPKSTSRVSRAQNDILTILVNNFPERTEEIDAQ